MRFTESRGKSTAENGIKAFAILPDVYEESIRARIADCVESSAAAAVAWGRGAMGRVAQSVI